MPNAQQFTFTTDLERIDLNKVHHWISTDAYWALGRPFEVVQRAAEGSMNFGAFDDAGELRAYARVVTDEATFAWLCDVYVDPECRGYGLCQKLTETVITTLEPFGLKRVLLATTYSHSLYTRVGFVPLPEPHKFMVFSKQG